MNVCGCGVEHQVWWLASGWSASPSRTTPPARDRGSPSTCDGTPRTAIPKSDSKEPVLVATRDVVAGRDDAEDDRGPRRIRLGQAEEELVRRVVRRGQIGQRMRGRELAGVQALVDGLRVRSEGRGLAPPPAPRTDSRVGSRRRSRTRWSSRPTCRRATEGDDLVVVLVGPALPLLEEELLVGLVACSRCAKKVPLVIRLGGVHEAKKLSMMNGCFSMPGKLSDIGLRPGDGELLSTKSMLGAQSG